MNSIVVSGIRTLLLASLAGTMIVPALSQEQVFPLHSAAGLVPINVKIESVEYQGKKAIRVLGTPGNPQIALVKGSSFLNGTIEAEIAGKPRDGADSTARGFVGIAFRVREADTIRYECFYLRPTNARAEDQLRRNHSTQYISIPGSEWYVLRREHPGEYESYVDLVPGAWTKVRIVVKNNEARLFVANAEQPCLIVRDLKQGVGSGMIGLWIGLGTEAYFSNLKISPQ